MSLTQVGVVALESARDPDLSRPYPFDVLGAQTQGMIGYWLVQALSDALPGQPACCLLGQTVVRADDPAFASPAKFVGPVYEKAQARQVAATRGWAIAQDGHATGPVASQDGGRGTGHYAAPQGPARARRMRWRRWCQPGRRAAWTPRRGTAG